jgi:hypothetical protein
VRDLRRAIYLCSLSKGEGFLRTNKELRSIASASAPADNRTAIFERHFTPKTLAELWAVSSDTIYRWFKVEPGVIKTAGGDLRIPESVAERVYRNHSSEAA